MLPLPVGGNSFFLGRFLREKIDPKTGERYFLLAYRTPGGVQPIVFTEYRPGAGFVHETSLEEGTISSTSLASAIVEVNDSTFVVFGRNHVRQVTHRPGQGVVVNWQRPYYQGNVNAAILTDDGGFISATQSGNILAINANGDSLWKTTAGFTVRDIKKTAQGFVTCGRNANKAVVAEYSSTGVLLWSQEYADNKTYEHIIVENDGSLTVTGQSVANEIVLHHLNASGVSLWRKAYQTGSGGSLVKTADGGYVVAGALLVSPQRFCVIKTDAEGNTGAFEASLLPAFRQLENEQMLAQFSPSARLFSGTSIFESGFLVPKDSLTSTYFAAGLWLGGHAPDSMLSLAAATYRNDTRSDYRAGLSHGSSVNDFNHTWYVSRSEIEALRQDWADNGQIDQHIPHDILTWPGRSNPNFVQNLDFSKPLTDKALLPAPFVDANGDGIYSPADGDYPRIKGDQMVWWVISDSTEHTETSGRPLVLDIATSAYLYECTQNAQLQNTLFVDYEMVNRSGKPYSDMFAGIWSDPDLGCAFDDYIGCLPQSNAYFTYNQDAVDGNPGTNCDGGAPTFGEKVPVASTTILNTTLDKFSYYNNGFPNPSEPAQALEYYNQMRGIFYSGGIGFDTIDHVFPDNPADPNGNSMCSANLPSGDRRTIGSTGPFTLAPNDTFRLQLAFTYHPDIPHPCPDIYSKVKTDIDQLRDLANSGALGGPANLPPLVQLQVGQSVVLNAEVPGASAYQWSSGNTTPQISVSQPGTYTVTITKATGCQSVETVVVRLSSGVQEGDWLQQFRLFPNPNNGQFRVEMSGPAQDEVEFTLFNAVGQLMRREVEGFGTGTLARTFDYGQLPTGVYALRVQAGGKSSVNRFVVERH